MKVFLLITGIVLLLLGIYMGIAYFNLSKMKNGSADEIRIDRFTLVYNNADEMVNSGKLSKISSRYAVYDYFVWCSLTAYIMNHTGDGPGFKVFRFSLFPFGVQYVCGDS